MRLKAIPSEDLLPLPVPWLTSPCSLCAAQLVDQVLMSSVFDSQTFCVRAAGGALTVTLAWADYPCDPAAAVCLVNDLDLTVRATGLAGYVLYGNGQPDHVNNVEQV